MTVLVAALGALGLLLIYDGTTRRDARVVRTRKPLEELAGAAGVSGLTGSRVLLLSSGSGFIAFAVAAGLSSSVVVATVLGAWAFWFPLGWLRGRAARRIRRFREAWPDALASLIAGVRAGLSLPDSCAALAQRGPDDLAQGFRSFAATYRSSGSFAVALERLRLVLSDPIADRVVAALRLTQDVGGTELVRVLWALSDFVREDLRVRKEVEARWSWTITAARVAAAAPWLVLILMATRPEAARAYSSPEGALVIGIGAVATFGGYRLMLRAARLPEDRRLGT